jgi:DNA primase
MSDTVEGVLTKNNIQFQKMGRRYLIRCLNPEHPDNHPSLSIDSMSGLGKCFACGYKLNIFSHFGADYNFQSIKVYKLLDKLEILKAGLVGLEMPENYRPVTREFRGISGKTLQRFNAFTVDTAEEYHDRIAFPLEDSTGKIRCFISRHLHSDIQPKYIVRPHKVEVPLFPATVKPYKNCVFFVEGIFDALNLIDKGLENVVCVFGTTTITQKSKQKFAELQMRGVNKIFLVFDGDKAGSDGMKTAKPILESMGFLVEIVELDDGMDPGDMELEDVQNLKRILDETYSSAPKDE